MARGHRSQRRRRARPGRTAGPSRARAAAGRRPTAPPAPAPGAPLPPGEGPAAAELRLLALARELAAPGGDGGRGAALAPILERLASAFGPRAPLPRALYQAWLETRNDKDRILALAWAREQLRLAVEEALAATGRRGALAVPGETLAWLVLAACESLAHEPAAAVPDRVRALLELTGLADPDA